jgi:hypothetical protein
MQYNQPQAVADAPMHEGSRPQMRIIVQNERLACAGVAELADAPDSKSGAV